MRCKLCPRKPCMQWPWPQITCIFSFLFFKGPVVLVQVQNNLKDTITKIDPWFHNQNHANFLSKNYSRLTIPSWPFKAALKDKCILWVNLCIPDQEQVTAAYMKPGIIQWKIFEANDYFKTNGGSRDSFFAIPSSHTKNVLSSTGMGIYLNSHEDWMPKAI